MDPARGARDYRVIFGRVHARIETDLDKDMPLVGGKRLKAHARFFVNTDSVPFTFAIARFN